jgi:uncharacterized protein YkwD
MATRTGALLIILGLLLPSSSAAQSTDAAAVPVALSQLHQRVNAYRLAAGCEVLQWHEPTARVAAAHSKDMATRDYFDHLTPEGTDLTHRLQAGGVSWRGSIAENIALTAQGPEVVIELWVDSPPHRANLENCIFTHQGLGVFRDRWTQVLIERPGG